MSREAVITKESTFRVAQGDFTELKKTVTRLSITVEEDGIGRVIERTPTGGEYAYGRDRLRSELGEEGWRALLLELGVAS
jgi:Arc/MetJ family transcription regulator